MILKGESRKKCIIYKSGEYDYKEQTARRINGDKFLINLWTSYERNYLKCPLNS